MSDKKTRESTRIMFDRYHEILSRQPRYFVGSPEKTSNSHLLEMCRSVNCDTWPIDKLSRWLGFIQGVMTMRNLITVDKEREFSRPLFDPIPKTGDTGAQL